MQYNDPLYVKMEKLEIMVRLASLATIDAVLLEWREYATEVDVDFVRKAVRAIGRAAIALEGAAERCIGVLLELIQTKARAGGTRRCPVTCSRSVSLTHTRLPIPSRSTTWCRRLWL